MTYTQKLDALYEEARIEINNAIERKGQKSEFNNEKAILLPIHLRFSLRDGFLAEEMSSDSILNCEGKSYGYPHLKYEELMAITDYVKAL